MPMLPDYLRHVTWFPGTRFDRPSSVPGVTPPTNGIVTSMLSPDDRAAVRRMNVALTEEAIRQCGLWIGVRNQIEFGTQVANALDEFQSHGVTPDLLRKLSADHDIVFPSVQRLASDRFVVPLRAVVDPQHRVFAHGVDGLTDTLDPFVSDTAWSGIPDLQLGSQTANPPRLDYVKAYWSSPTHDFVPFLIEVKNEYDPDDLFQFAQSVPLEMPG